MVPPLRSLYIQNVRAKIMIAETGPSTAPATHALLFRPDGLGTGEEKVDVGDSIKVDVRKVAGELEGRVPPGADGVKRPVVDPVVGTLGCVENEGAELMLVLVLVSLVVLVEGEVVLGSGMEAVLGLGAGEVLGLGVEEVELCNVTVLINPSALITTGQTSFMQHVQGDKATRGESANAID